MVNLPLVQHVIGMKTLNAMSPLSTLNTLIILRFVEQAASQESRTSYQPLPQRHRQGLQHLLSPQAAGNPHPPLLQRETFLFAYTLPFGAQGRGVGILGLVVGTTGWVVEDRKQKGGT